MIQIYNRHAIRANVNKPSDANICQANDSYKVKSMPVKSISSATDRYDAIFLLPDSCQHSAAPTRGELGKNEDRGWSETIHSALIIHAHFHESTGRGGVEYRKRYQSSWFCIIALLVVF